MVNMHKRSILIILLTLISFLLTGCINAEAMSADYEQIPKINQNTEYININDDIDLNSNKIVFIDPGHGFSDGGTKSPEGIGFDLKESEIVLDVGLRVRDILKNNNITVVMSRTTDIDERQKDKTISLKLEERVKAANNINATAFVSIHVNAFEDSSDVRGASIYYCKKDDEYNKKSESLAQNIIDEFTKHTNADKTPSLEGRKRGSSFYVNRAAKMPSVLFELGFITNVMDSENFASNEWRQKAAEGIASGIMKWLEQQ